MEVLCDMKKSLALFGLISLCALFAFSVLPVSAHPPSNMTLLYETNTQVLSVTVFHSVADPNTHYIEYVVVNRNGAFAIDRNYTSQTSASAFVDVFTVDADDGDVLQVTAICSISGQLVDQITVSTGIQTQPTPLPSIPGFPCVATVIGLSLAVGFALIRRRRQETP